MRCIAPHDWHVSPKEAIIIQQGLRDRVVKQDGIGEINRVAGVDVGFEDNGRTTRAAVALLSYPELEFITYAIGRRATSFPYVPGLLSFREVPAVLDALASLRQTPDVLICDGQGVAHPRRFGIACHLGVITDLPAIGVAKKRLVGEHEEVPAERGRWVPLTDHGEVIGAVLRTRERVKPLFVSSGHKVSLKTAVDLVMSCCTRYRLPETTRQADRLASGKGRAS